jgi:hypothetical protein
MNRVKNAAEMIMKFDDYPANVKEKMQSAFESEEYQRVLDLAALHDVTKRESLDGKIIMIEPEDELDPNLPREIAEFRAACEGKGQPLYKAEGIEDRIFETAADAIEAYKIANNIPIPDKSKHTFKKSHFFPEDEGMTPPPQKDVAALLEDAEQIDLDEDE